MDHESAIEKNEVAQPDEGLSAEEQMRRLREENARLREENAKLRVERDIYHRSVTAWAKEKFAAMPLPPENLEDYQDFGPFLQELMRQPTER